MGFILIEKHLTGFLYLELLQISLHSKFQEIVAVNPIVFQEDDDSHIFYPANKLLNSDMYRQGQSE